MKTCFIIMPMTTRPDQYETYNGDPEHFEHVLEVLLKPAVKEAGLAPMAPAAEGADVIHAMIIDKLQSADLVLCDMSALNPNVFFELGIRTALNKPTCHIRDDRTKHVPFDTGIVNYHIYRSTLSAWEIQDQIKQLADYISSAMQNSDGNNSLWKYFGISASAHVAPTDGSDDKMDYLIRRMDALTAQIEARRTPSQPPSEAGSAWVSDLLRRAAADQPSPNAPPRNPLPPRAPQSDGYEAHHDVPPPVAPPPVFTPPSEPTFRRDPPRSRRLRSPRYPRNPNDSD